MATESEIMINEPFADQLGITVEAHIPPQLPVQDGERKAALKAGLLVTLVSLGGILNPPIPAPANQTHALLSKAFQVIIYVSLAVGVVQILLSKVLHRLPRLVFMAERLAEIGWALVTITVGYGSSLVLMVASFPWFALYIIFLSIQFIM